MKKYFYLLSLSFLFTISCTAQVPHFKHIVGVQSGVTNTITFDLDQLETQFEAHLALGDITAALSNFRIEQFTEEGVIYYQLLADDETALTRCGVKLVLDGGKFYEAIVNGGGSSVSCAGCTKGCSPRRDHNGDGWCTDCNEVIGTTQNCSKTESLSSSSVFTPDM